MTTSNDVVPSSFRDPSGVLFWKDGMLHCQVSAIYRANYDHLMEVGLHDSLVDAGLLVPREEVPTDNGATDSV